MTRRRFIPLERAADFGYLAMAQIDQILRGYLNAPMLIDGDRRHRRRALIAHLDNRHARMHLQQMFLRSDFDRSRHNRTIASPALQAV